MNVHYISWLRTKFVFTFVCRWHVPGVDLRFLPARTSLSTLFRRRSRSRVCRCRFSWMQSNRLKLYSDKADRSPLVCNRSTPTSTIPTAILSIDSVPVIPVYVLRREPRDFHWRWFGFADTCSVNSISLLRCAPSTASNPLLCADVLIPNTGGCSGLWQWRC
jgi:hypothetical protein